VKSRCMRVSNQRVESALCNAKVCMQAETPDRPIREAARPPAQCGSMKLLYDETDELELRRAARDEQLTNVRSRRRFSSLGFY
jgi:hypothetical protein